MEKLSGTSITFGLLVFNEEQNIISALDDTRRFAEVAVEDFEILVVDDGSTDDSVRLIHEYQNAYSGIRLISHGTNRGMGAGIRTVIKNSTKDYFIFNAADGQIPAEEGGKLIPILNRADIVSSVYENRRESAHRELVSRGFRGFLKVVAGMDFELQGLYLYPTSVAKVIEPLCDSETFFLSFELIQRGIERGLTLETTGMRCVPRLSGSSKVFNPKRIGRVGKEALRYGARKWFFFGIDTPNSRF